MKLEFFRILGVSDSWADIVEAALCLNVCGCEVGPLFEIREIYFLSYLGQSLT